MNLIDEVRGRVRVNSKKFDDMEILPLINACKQDLHLAGIDKVDENDPLVRQAIALYAKTHFGYADDGERWQKAYAALRDSMALAGGYRADGS